MKIIDFKDIFGIKKNKILQDKILELEELLSPYNDQYNTIQKRIMDMVNEESSLLDKIAKSKKILEELELNILDLDNKISSNDSILKKIQNEVESSLGEKEQLTKEVAELKKESKQRAKELEQIELKRKKIEQQVQESEKILALNNESHLNLEKDIQEMQIEKLALIEKLQVLKAEVVELDDVVLFQEYGLYQPVYEFSKSSDYKVALEINREKQKLLIKNKTAVSYIDTWVLDGSKVKGRKMNNDNIKQIIRTFNTECEMIIDKVTFSNVESMKQRIYKSFNSLNKMNESNVISLKSIFLDLKIEELQLSYEYQVKKKQEKEEQKRQREELREQAKLEKELAELRKNAEKDLKHYEKALNDIDMKLKTKNLEEEERDALTKRQQEMIEQKKLVEENLSVIDYRQSNQKAGYVYIISNIGAFGEDVYKIGMTRRLEPQERIDELGGASVPFKFDVHAMIFTDDAPKLENALHKAFSNKKVNMVNSRKEFFNVTLSEIEEVVRNNFDKTVEFNYLATAEQYRESLRIKESME